MCVIFLYFGVYLIKSIYFCMKCNLWVDMYMYVCVLLNALMHLLYLSSFIVVVDIRLQIQLHIET